VSSTAQWSPILARGVGRTWGVQKPLGRLFLHGRGVERRVLAGCRGSPAMASCRTCWALRLSVPARGKEGGEGGERGEDG